MSRFVVPLLLVVSASAQAGVWHGSTSPDGKLGVTVPDGTSGKVAPHGNALVEVASGKALATLDSDTAADHMELDIAPRWSRDGGVLVWFVDGRLGSWALDVVRLDHGKLAWQVDARAQTIARALADARAAKPQLYAAVVAHGKDSGAWFHDGFAIDVRADLPDSGPAFPMKIQLTMTSDPKDLDRIDVPRLDAHMTAELAADGKLSFGKLAIDKARP